MRRAKSLNSASDTRHIGGFDRRWATIDGKKRSNRREDGSINGIERSPRDSRELCGGDEDGL